MTWTIKVENLSKKYCKGEVQLDNDLRESVNYFLKTTIENVLALFQKGSSKNNLGIKERSSLEFWGLKNINLEVQQGDVLGIIGQNGAGKSTLLKILSRITVPTCGSIRYRGRIASLLEVGTGFHRELTGRENIFLNGSILGMRRAEIKKHFDEIVDFAGIDDFIDTPVKFYSSGMYVRLAFGVAAHLYADILLVDEVLAVGDANFQRKCLRKMKEVTSKTGRTVIFVSHNMGAIRQICNRALLLKKGEIVNEGSATSVVDFYLKQEMSDFRRKMVFKDDPSKPIQILEAVLYTPQKTELDPLDIADKIQVKIRYLVRQDISGTNLVLVLSKEGVVVFNSFDIDLDWGKYEKRRSGDYLAEISLPFKLLTAGTYSIGVGVGRPWIGSIEFHADVLQFELDETSEDITHRSYAKARGGLLIMPLAWNTTAISKIV